MVSGVAGEPALQPGSLVRPIVVHHMAWIRQAKKLAQILPLGPGPRIVRCPKMDTNDIRALSALIIRSFGARPAGVVAERYAPRGCGIRFQPILPASPTPDYS
jgi:hypothetical protein